MKIMTLDPDLLYCGPILTKISPCGALWWVKICVLVAIHLVFAPKKNLGPPSFTLWWTQFAMFETVLLYSGDRKTPIFEA
jgi:hypothetical protein